uniref:Uncharacterized protein n=1 Tax=Physcomitrium patens TaxID=3218 RepID=A0A2K1KQJ0_PHYPA|nr:hypothetical protein PHYPA_006951 [Physcomitrium patens]
MQESDYSEEVNQQDDFENRCRSLSLSLSLSLNGGPKGSAWSRIQHETRLNYTQTLPFCDPATPVARPLNRQRNSILKETHTNGAGVAHTHNTARTSAASLEGTHQEACQFHDWCVKLSPSLSFLLRLQSASGSPQDHTFSIIDYMIVAPRMLWNLVQRRWKLLEEIMRGWNLPYHHHWREAVIASVVGCDGGWGDSLHDSPTDHTARARKPFVSRQLGVCGGGGS